jgi:pyrophosphate--fructose-6-phosphate 1-phosphotransferase
MRVAFLTAGGLAPCLSSAVGYLTDFYTKKDKKIELFSYLYGYQGLLKGDLVEVSKNDRKNALILTKLGGSPIGNSRVKLTNNKDLVKRGLIKEGQEALEVAAKQLIKDKIDVLHTIGGDDTNTTAADLAQYLKDNNYDLQVVGLPKTIDNDIIPVKQSLGADTAAENGAKFAFNVISEHSAAPKTLIIHEVMGRHSGYLTVETAKKYRELLSNTQFSEYSVNKKIAWDIHGIYIPEVKFTIKKEATRLKKIMKTVGCINVFLAEGAISEDMIPNADGLPKDAFGHIQLDKLNPGQWLGDELGDLIGAEKVIVQKSGYFSRSGASNRYDLSLIKKTCEIAVEASLAGESGLVGIDDNSDKFTKNFKPTNRMSVIEFSRIDGGKPFDIKDTDYKKMILQIGQ